MVVHQRNKLTRVRTLNIPSDFQLRSLGGRDERSVSATSKFVVCNRAVRGFKLVVSKVFGTMRSFVRWLLYRFGRWLKSKEPPEPVEVPPPFPKSSILLLIPLGLWLTGDLQICFRNLLYFGRCWWSDLVVKPLRPFTLALVSLVDFPFHWFEFYYELLFPFWYLPYLFFLIVSRLPSLLLDVLFFD